MRLSLARERERGLATASLSGARMMSLFAAFAGERGRIGEPWHGSGYSRSEIFSEFEIVAIIPTGFFTCTLGVT